MHCTFSHIRISNTRKIASGRRHQLAALGGDARSHDRATSATRRAEKMGAEQSTPQPPQPAADNVEAAADAATAGQPERREPRALVVVGPSGEIGVAALALCARTRICSCGRVSSHNALLDLMLSLIRSSSSDLRA